MNQKSKRSILKCKNLSPYKKTHKLEKKFTKGVLKQLSMANLKSLDKKIPNAMSHCMSSSKNK